MALILNLETATTNCSVSLAKDGDVIAIHEDNSPKYSHSENLHRFIEHCLQEAGVQVSDLHAVAVGKGPGSFTGLRIGVSAAKGLCYALGIPLISTSTLRVLAAQPAVQEGLLIPMLDARRDEVYTAVYDTALNEVHAPWAEILKPNSFSELAPKGPLHFIGGGAQKAGDILKTPGPEWYPDLVPSAREMAILSYKNFLDKHFEDTAYFEPYYLKDFVGVKKK